MRANLKMAEQKRGPIIDPKSSYDPYKENDPRPRIIVEKKRTQSEAMINFLTIITSLITIAAAIKYLLFS
jgi:hypothetical protein